MCPVLDVKAAELQKRQIKRNERKMALLEKAIKGNNERIEEGVERMKQLKVGMAEAIFNMKEAVKKEDVDLETTLMTKEESEVMIKDYEYEAGLIYRGARGRPQLSSPPFGRSCGGG